MLSHYEDSIDLQSPIIHKPNEGEKRHSMIKSCSTLSQENY